MAGDIRVRIPGIVAKGVSNTNVELPDGSYAPQIVVVPSLDLLTDGGDGVSRRLMVDDGSTAFFAGKEFRTLREWSTPTTGSVVLKVTVPIDAILLEYGFRNEEGSIRSETVVGGTEGGSFSEVFPVFNTNSMTIKPQPPLVNQVVWAMGGTHTGGTVIDVLRSKTSGNSNFSAIVGADQGTMRGVGPGTYYTRLTLTGFVGVLKARWEEIV